MPQVAISNRLHPDDVVRMALSKALPSFSLLYADTKLLLIRLPSHDGGELADGLASTVPRPGEGAAIKPTLQNINFHTEILSEVGGLDNTPASQHTTAFNAYALRDLLAEHSYFILPLRKRPEADALSTDRISVGRARNKDIVLRDGSVSKFHGWFQLDDSGRFSFADAGSKNRTRINDKAIAPRALTRLEPGDSLTFGSVEAVLCSAETLWGALHLPAATTRVSRTGA